MTAAVLLLPDDIPVRAGGLADARLCLLQVRLTIAEHRLICSAARRDGLSLSAWLRQAARARLSPEPAHHD